VKRQELLGVDEPASAFGALAKAASLAGVRIGWLDLAGPPQPLPSLAEAATSGFRVAVEAGPEFSLTVRRRRGAPVLRDVLRQNFAGCRMVLVRGMGAGPKLAAAPEGWSLKGESRVIHLDTSTFLDRLARHRPFPELDEPE